MENKVPPPVAVNFTSAVKSSPKSNLASGKLLAPPGAKPGTSSGPRTNLPPAQVRNTGTPPTGNSSAKSCSNPSGKATTMPGPSRTEPAAAAENSRCIR